MREELASLLTRAGYEACAITGFYDVSAQVAALAPCLTLLDINLPGTSGFELCRQLSAQGIQPLLVLTSRDRLQDELHALDLGADDYLTKPFNSSRLLARINNLLTRFEGHPASAASAASIDHGLLDGGGFHLDPRTFTLYAGDRSTLLSTNEGTLLLTLLQHSPNVVSKATLCEALWGTSEFIDDNALQVNLTRLRKALTHLNLDHRVQTLRGQGYCLSMPPV
jgi:DNA-binding response OmpR family regulator